MNVLLIGAGRMGLRHLRGLRDLDGKIYVVDPRIESEKEVLATAAEHGVKAPVYFFPSVKDVRFDSVQFDAAILAQTAQGRLDSFRDVANANIRHVLVEKPVEQSRTRFRQIVDIARKEGIDVKCNHYRRSLPYFSPVREDGDILRIIVTGGAFGLGCVGIHWIDFAIYLSKSTAGRLIAGHIEDTPIASGRGAAFRDYGGWGLFSLESECELFLSSSAASSAPAIALIVQKTGETIIDQEKDLAIVYKRDPSSHLPNYRYGADYLRSEVTGIEKVGLWDLTAQWIGELDGREVSSLPSLREASLAHELLFDLLETSGATEFAIT